MHLDLSRFPSLSPARPLAVEQPHANTLGDTQIMIAASCNRRCLLASLATGVKADAPARSDQKIEKARVNLPRLASILMLLLCSSMPCLLALLRKVGGRHYIYMIYACCGSSCLVLRAPVVCTHTIIIVSISLGGDVLFRCPKGRLNASQLEDKSSVKS